MFKDKSKFKNDPVPNPWGVVTVGISIDFITAYQPLPRFGPFPFCRPYIPINTVIGKMYEISSSRVLHTLPLRYQSH